MKSGVSSPDCGPITTVASVYQAARRSTYQLGLGRFKKLSLGGTSHRRGWFRSTRRCFRVKAHDLTDVVNMLGACTLYCVLMETDACNKLAPHFNDDGDRFKLFIT